MRRPTAVPLPPEADPPGVTIRDFGGAADAEGVLAVNAAAFAAHPEQGSMSAADLAERMAEPWFDPAGLLLAIGADGELLGFHWTKRHDADHGEVYVIGVSPAAHGRGLGRALTVAGLRHLASRGVAEVHLYVESDNDPALRLYSGLGFTHAAADTHVQYRPPIPRVATVTRNPYAQIASTPMSSVTDDEPAREERARARWLRAAGVVVGCPGSARTTRSPSWPSSMRMTSRRS